MSCPYYAKKLFESVFGMEQNISGYECDAKMGALLPLSVLLPKSVNCVVLCLYN